MKKWQKFTLGATLSFVVFAVLIALQFAIDGLLMSLGVDISSDIAQLIYSIIIYISAVAILVSLPRLFGKEKPTTTTSLRSSLGLSGLPKWSDIVYGVIGLVASMILAGILLVIVMYLFPEFDATEAQDISHSLTAFGPGLIFTFLAIVVVAPIFEEIIFRGWLYGTLSSKIGRNLALIFTAISFAAVHLQWNVAIVVGAMSIIMCVLREFTGTIYASIILHALKNALAFFILAGIITLPY